MAEGEDVSIAAGLRVILGVAWYLSFLVLVILLIRTVFALAGSPIAALDFAVPFRIDADVYTIESARHGVGGARILKAVGTLELHGASPMLVATSTATALLWVCGALVVVYQLRRIFARI